MALLFQADQITKQYQMGEVTVQALRGASFDLCEGEFIVILGPSGSGKSTILNIIGGIDKPTSGTALFHNSDLGKMNDRALTTYRRNAVGFVFQFYNLIPNLTARENILLAANLAETPLDVDLLLKQVGLLERGAHFPAQLSGGEQQRVAIARALSKNPDILLCDEPTGALDFTTGIQVLRLLKDFNQIYAKTVVLITHNSAIAPIADRVFHIRDGLVERITENAAPLSPEEVNW